MFAQTVGLSWSCVRSTASLRLRTLFHVLRDQSTRTTHSVSPELVCSGSSLLSKQLQHCLSHTRRLFRFSLLFQLHFVVVYSAVVADSTSGTSDTTAWSSVHGRCSRFTVEVLYNNVVCCLSPLSFWSLGRYHNVVPEVFNTTSVVVVRGKTSCVPSPSSLALLRQSLCFSRARGRPHVSEFCDRFVGAFRESLPDGPRCRAPPAARLLLNAVYCLLLNVCFSVWSARVFTCLLHV